MVEGIGDCGEVNEKMTYFRAKSVMRDIELPYGWTYDLRDRDDYLIFRVGADNDRCNVDGHEMSWRGRWFVIESTMGESEIVTAVFAAVMAAVEHETREKFLYKGVMVLGPHVNVTELLKIADRKVG